MPKHNWSKWMRLQELRKCNFDKVPEEPGVYQIASVKQKMIRRLRGKDNGGLLYVGESGSLRGRIRKFCDCVEDKKKKKETHVAGWRYNLVRLYRCAPPDSLKFRWRCAKNKAAALTAQSEVLYAYVDDHCELPPLNYNLERALMEKLGWRLKRHNS